MSTQITNQAFLTFEYGSQRGFVSSNIATTVLQDTLNVSKISLGNTYSLNEDIFYILTMVNNGVVAVNNIKINDNLGTYFLPNTDISVTPLSYVGPSQIYLNGVLNAELTPVITSNGINFEIDSIPSGSNAMLIYKVTVNNKAPLSIGSTITNTATWNINNSSENIVNSNTITVTESANVRILKSMFPNPISNGEEITYNFVLHNYGNTEATNVVLTDTFTPVPIIKKITVDGSVIRPAKYSFINGLLTLPSPNALLSLKVPAATFSQDMFTGIVTINPGISTITVTGKI